MTEPRTHVPQFESLTGDGSKLCTSGRGAHAAVALALEDPRSGRPGHLELCEIRIPRPRVAAEPAALRHQHDAPAAVATAGRRWRRLAQATNDASADVLHGGPHQGVLRLRCSRDVLRLRGAVQHDVRRHGGELGGVGDKGWPDLVSELRQ